jgi:hypothetical protein
LLLAAEYVARKCRLRLAVPLMMMAVWFGRRFPDYAVHFLSIFSFDGGALKCFVSKKDFRSEDPFSAKCAERCMVVSRALAR